MFNGKTVVLGITGSIAAYKAVDLASKLVEAGAEVDVIMSEAATEFVAPLTFRSITHRPVVVEMFDLTSEFSVEHIALAEKADVVVIAPATANVIAKLAAGIADDMLCVTVLATRAPVLIAPAMNVNMYENPFTQENLSKLRQRGFAFVGPAYGVLACGKTGMGRLADIDEILGAIWGISRSGGDLADRHILVTAGGTQEPIDPVRHIGNRSSGKMGYAIARAARDRGADVTLVSAPAALSPLSGVELIHVRTALEMQDAVLGNSDRSDAVIMTAAVADYRPSQFSEAKIKSKASTLELKLIRNPDILSQVKGPIKIGFAAESENLIENAKMKLREKGLDLVVANDITAEGGFDVDINQVTFIDKGGKMESLPLLPKLEVAHRVLDKVVDLLSKR